MTTKAAVNAPPTQALPMSQSTADHFRRDFVAGATAGCIMRAALFPVDTLKTNMQRSGSGIRGTLRGLLANPSPMSTLYRGLTPALLEIGINRGALMGVSTAVKKHLPDNVPEVARDAGAGLIAGMLKTSALHPLDTLTCRGQVGLMQWSLLWPIPRPRELYRGFVPAIVRSSGGMALWLTIRNSLIRSTPESMDQNPWRRDLLIGMTASGLTDMFTYPLDTLKKNMQADGGTASALVRRLVKDGGIVRLYRGYLPRLAIQAANGGLWNFVYVRIQELF